jgi:hypothetical protein
MIAIDLQCRRDEVPPGSPVGSDGSRQPSPVETLKVPKATQTGLHSQIAVALEGLPLKRLIEDHHPRVKGQIDDTFEKAVSAEIVEQIGEFGGVFQRFESRYQTLQIRGCNSGRIHVSVADESRSPALSTLRTLNLFLGPVEWWPGQGGYSHFECLDPAATPCSSIESICRNQLS